MAAVASADCGCVEATRQCHNEKERCWSGVRRSLGWCVLWHFAQLYGEKGILGPKVPLPVGNQGPQGHVSQW